MKNKDKLLYVSAAVLAAGSVAGVKTTTVKAAEVKQANVNANSKLDLNKASQILQLFKIRKIKLNKIKQLRRKQKLLKLKLKILCQLNKKQFQVLKLS